MNPATVDAVVALCRHWPEETRVRVRINNKPVPELTGAAFLELWEQPFAGTIDIVEAYFFPEYDDE